MSFTARQPATFYEQHRDYVLVVLARRCAWVNAEDREALYHDAYASMLSLERSGRLEPEAMHPRQLRVYLARAAVRKALDERKSAARRRTVPFDPSVDDRPDPARPVEERAAAAFDSGAVREILAELPLRQKAVLVSEIDAHRGSLRTLRLPEPPPVMRRALRGCRSASLEPEQVPSLVPPAYLKR